MTQMFERLVLLTIVGSSTSEVKFPHQKGVPRSSAASRLGLEGQFVHRGSCRASSCRARAVRWLFEFS